MLYIINLCEHEGSCSLIVELDKEITGYDVINEIRNIYNNNLEEICLENFKKYVEEDEELLKELDMNSKNFYEYVRQCGISHFFAVYKNEIIEHLYKRFKPVDEKIIIDINVESL